MPRRDTHTSHTGTQNKQTTPRKRHRIDPASMPLGSLLDHLGVDPHEGLSPREAEKRLHAAQISAGGRRQEPLFCTDTLSVPACLKQLCREPVLWLFVAVCLVAIFFDHIAIGLVCLGMTVAYGALSLMCSIRTQKINAAMLTLEMPLCRVLRNRLVRRISANGVVQGDIILLYPGDVVPADARLIEADPDLTIVEKELVGTPSDRRSVPLQKSADAVVISNGRMQHSPENMVYAGGVIKCGRARAVVVATGSRTHWGAMTGGIHPLHAPALPSSFRRMARIIDLCSLVSLVLVIPMTAVGILTLGDRYDLIDIVLAVLTPCITGLTGHLLLRLTYIGATIRDRAAEAPSEGSSVEIRCDSALETLRQVDEIVLLGTAGLHDGIPHLRYLLVGNTLFDASRSGTKPGLKRIADHAYLYTHSLARMEAAGELLPVGPDELPLLQEQIDLWSEVFRWSEKEAEAIELSVTGTSILPTQKTGELPSVRLDRNRGGSVVLRLCFEPTEVLACPYYFDGIGMMELDAGSRDDLLQAYRRARSAGLRTCFLLSVQEDKACVEAMAAYAPATCPETADLVQTLRADGIAVTAFLRTTSGENTRILKECGITKGISSDRPERGLTSRRSAFLLQASGVTAFEGCSSDYIRDYITARQQAGHRLAVLSGDSTDSSLLKQANVACTVCPKSIYRTVPGYPSAASEPDAHTRPDGSPDAACGTDLSRRRSLITVRRAGSTGGGLFGIKTALETAERYRCACNSLLRYWCLSQLLRLLMLLVPLCMGVVLPGASWMLFSGLVADLVVLLSLAGADHKPQLRKRSAGNDHTGVNSQRGLPWPVRLEDLVGIGVTIACLWIIVGIAIWQAVSFGTATLAGYVGASLLSAQLAIYLTDPVLMRKTRSGMVCLLLFVLLWIGALAVSLSSGLRLYWSLVFPIGGAVLFLLMREVTRWIIQLVRWVRRAK